MEITEAESLFSRMKGDMDALVKESRAAADEFTKTPRTAEEMAAYMVELHKVQQQKVNAIFSKYYDRENDKAR